MTTEQLLQPRYMVIADYPKSIYPVGDIIRAGGRNGDCIYCDTEGPRLSHYPHLFRPMPWYEGRNVEDMPEYVKVVAYHQSYGDIKLNSIRNVTAWEKSKNGTSWLCDSFPVYLKTDDIHPATAQEFADQIKFPF